MGDVGDASDAPDAPDTAEETDTVDAPSSASLVLVEFGDNGEEKRGDQSGAGGVTSRLHADAF